jgi:uncharacterized protein (TIGR04255 family)
MASYPKAPIVEAVIALHFALPPDIGALEKFAKKQQKHFPKLETIHQITAKISPKENEQKATTRLQGFKVSDADQGIIIQITESQLGISKLAPYGDWTGLYDEAFKAWKSLKKYIGNVELKRVSTRFINRIDIPSPAGKEIILNEYFKFGLALPDIDSKLRTLQFNISCRLRDEKNILDYVLRLGKVESPLLDHASFTLDIDVITVEPVPRRDEDIWSKIDSLRERKNTVFEASITDKTRALFA